MSVCPHDNSKTNDPKVTSLQYQLLVEYKFILFFIAVFKYFVTCRRQYIDRVVTLFTAVDDRFTKHLKTIIKNKTKINMVNMIGCIHCSDHSDWVVFCAVAYPGIFKTA